MTIIAYLCLLTGVFFVAYASYNALSSGLTAFNVSLVGFGIFGFMDAAKYYLIERHIRGDFGDDLFLLTLAAFILSFLIFLFGRTLVKKSHFSRSPLAKNKVYSRNATNKIYAISPLIFVINIIPLGPAYGALINVSSIGFFLATAIFAIQSRNKFLAVFALAAISIFLFSFGYSSRRIIISVSAPIFMLVLWQSGKLRAHHRFLARSAIFVSLIIVFVYLNFMRAEHNYGAGYIDDNKLQNTINYITTLRSIDTFWNTAYIFNKFPDEFSYYYGKTYAAIPVALIPRRVWPDKPVGLSAILGIMQRFNIQEKFSHYTWADTNNFSLSPGLLGEAYANFGILGVVFVPMLLGFFVQKTDRAMQKDKLHFGVTYSVLISIFFLIHRGDAYSAIIYPVFLYFGSVFGSKIIFRKQRRHIVRNRSLPLMLHNKK